MPIPPFYGCIEPLLRILAEAKTPLARPQAFEQTAQLLRLSEDERDARIKSGQRLYENRVGWALDRLKRNGLASSPRRGQWTITPEGRKLLTDHPSGLPRDMLMTLARPSRAEPGNKEPRQGRDEPSQEAALPALSPTERIDQAIAEITDSVAQDLLETVMQSTPAFFEDLVLDLLHAMGYGGSRDDLQRVGGSGDGGIDGVISLDRLGLEKVYVQAKRWQGSVGAPVIQTFLGALQLQGAGKGVLLTTGAFTKDARTAAEHARGKVVLIDGPHLAKLMIEYGVGVTHRDVRVPRVDGEYFEAEG